jgi:hypothetical protein
VARFLLGNLMLKLNHGGSSFDIHELTLLLCNGAAASNVE